MRRPVCLRNWRASARVWNRSSLSHCLRAPSCGPAAVPRPRVGADGVPPQRRSIEAATGKKADAPRKQLKESIIAANELFQSSDYLLSDELSLVDCTLAPLFWRLPAYGIALGKSATAVQGYIQRLFNRPSFKSSLTTAERELILNAS